MEWLKRMLGLPHRCITKDDHRFNTDDILNYRDEPKCVYCGRTLSELAEENNIPLIKLDETNV